MQRNKDCKNCSKVSQLSKKQEIFEEITQLQVRSYFLMVLNPKNHTLPTPDVPQIERRFHREDNRLRGEDTEGVEGVLGGEGASGRYLNN